MTKFKVLNALLFRCSSTDCPKHRDSYTSQIKTASEPIWDQFKWNGCAQFKTFIYGLSEQTHSESEWQEAPLIGVILPCPDPTGAQGAGTGHGVGRDIILESIFAAHSEGPLRVALFYLTRGYSFEKVYRGDILSKPINQAAISNCAPYIFQEILQLNPHKLLLCGNEVGDLFFSKSFNLPEYRRENNLTVTISDKQFPVQVTYAPHFCSINPSYLKVVREDCKKLFETTEPFPLGNYKILKNLPDVLDYLDMLSEFEGFIAVDTETENLNRKASNRLGTIQFATDTSLGVVIPYQHKETPFDTNELNLIAKRLKLLFRSKIRAAGWVGHNVKFEHTVFYNHFGTRIKSADIYDTQAMAFLLDETRSERKADVPRNMGIYTLKVLAWDYLNFDGYNKGILKEREEGTLIDLPLDALAAYGALDAYITLALKNKIEEKAAEEGYLKQMIKLARLYYGPASHLVSHVEYQGFKVDLKAVRELAANRGPFNKRLEQLTEEFKQMPAFIEANNILVRKKNAGNPKGVFGKVPWILDIAKPGNKKLVFFDIMGLDPVSFSDKTGQAAVDDEFIDAYREDYPEVEKYAQFSETTKMLDTFIVKALDRVDPETGDPDCKLDQRIRPSFHISRLVTGRWAVTQPNTQQLPKCLCGESLISTSKGIFEIKTLVESKKKDLLLPTRDGMKPVINFLSKEIESIYQINSERGTRIKGSDIHPVLVYSQKCRLEWKKLKEVSLDDYLVITTNTLKHTENPCWDFEAPEKTGPGQNSYKKQTLPKKLNPKLSRLFGYWLSEGYSKTKSHTLEFCNKDERIIEDYIDCFKENFPDAKIIERVDERDQTIYVTVHSKDIKLFLEFLGMDYTRRSHTQEIPWVILQANYENFINFYNAYLLGDGNVTVAGKTFLLRVFSVSEKMMRQMRSLLLGWGHYCSSHVQEKENVKPLWFVCSNGKDALRLFDELPLKFKNVKNPFSEKGEKLSEKIPYLKDFMRDNLKKKRVRSGVYITEKGEEKLYFNCLDNPSPNFSRKQITPTLQNSISRVFPEIGKDLTEILEKNWILEKIKDIEQIHQPQSVYDFTIADTHSYIAGGAIVHNSESEADTAEDQLAVRKAVKDLYTVDVDCGLIQVDYKVNEVRWAAILAKDTSLARIFKEAAESLKEAQKSEDPELLKKAEFAEDIHRATAKDMFNCSLDEVTKAQRSAAKCVHPETLIYTPEGWKRIGSLDKINRNEDTFSDIKEKVWDNTTNDFVDAYKFYSKGSEDSLGIVTSKGVLICSKNHRIKLADGQLIFAENLKKGDLLAFDTPPSARTLEYQVINFNPFFKNYEPTCSPYQVKITEDLAYALGAFIGDGSAPVRRLHFAVGAPEKYDSWKKSIIESFHKIGFRAYILKNKKDIYLGSESEANFFRQLGILTSKKEELKIREIKKQKNYKKVLHPRKLLRVPDYIFNSPDSVKLSFLAGLFDTDGTAASRDGRISISTKSLLLAQDVCVLLFQLGFNYSVNSHYNYIYNRNYFLINLRSEHIADVLPYTRHPLKKEILQKFKDVKKRKPTQFAKVQSIEVSLPELLNCHLVDITVDTQDHLFLTNGFSSHNCVTFGILFQQSAKALAVNLNCSEEQAEEYITMYFAKMVGVRNLVDTLKQSAANKGFVEAPHGRRRRFWSHLLPLTWKGRRKHISRSSRQAVNSPIQGCQDEDDFISTLQGPVRLKNLDPRIHTLYTYSGKTSRYKVHDTGIQKTFMVNTTVGCARTTKDHRYFVYENKDFVVKKLEELKVGDWVLGSEIHWDNPYTDSSELIKLAEVQAILIGDGSYNSNRTMDISFEKKEGYIDYVRDLIKSIYPTSDGKIQKSTGSKGTCWKLTYHDASLKKFLNRNGLIDRTSHQKRLPEWIFNASEKVRLAALRGLYDTDGGIVKAEGKGERCVFTTVSEHLAYDFYSLALSCNIKSTIYPYANCYRVKIDSKDSEYFIKKIKPWHKYKTKIKNSNKLKLLPPELIKDVASFVLDSYEWNEFLPKEAYSKYSRVAPKKNFTSQERSHLYRLKEGSGSTSSCLYFLNKLSPSSGRDNLLELCRLPWGQIYGIKPLGFKRTKDIEILTKDHSYISNGILMHNCASDGGMIGGAYSLLEFIEENNLDWKIQNLVHDSCIFQVPKMQIEFAINLMQSIFVDKAMAKMAEMGVEFNLPLGIDVEVGIHWGSLNKWNGTASNAKELEQLVKDYWDKI